MSQAAATTLTLDGAGAQTFVPGGVTLPGDLVLSGGTKTVGDGASASDLVVSGTVTVAGGTTLLLDDTAGSLASFDGGAAGVVVDGVLEVRRDLDLAGALTVSGTGSLVANTDPVELRFSTTQATTIAAGGTIDVQGPAGQKTNLRPVTTCGVIRT